jgi:hypothetical protein
MSRSKLLLALAACAILGGIGALAESLPASTAIPVIFTQSAKAGKTKPGERIVARTSQAVFLPGGEVLPAGTTVVGHVTESREFAFDSSPYAMQKPSVLAIHFDTIVEGGANVPVELLARAVAGPVASHEAEIPHYRDEIDAVGERILIGGDEFSPLQNSVLSPSRNVVGYHRKDGVFARLLAATYVSPASSLHCEATGSEESVGIFSANACGIYGLTSVEMVQNGSDAGGSIVLESLHQTIALNAGSTALLQVLAH